MNQQLMTCGQASYLIDVAIAMDFITRCGTVEGPGNCRIRAFCEDEMKRILEIPPEILVVTLVPIG